MAMHGGCVCGAVRYILARDVPPPVYCCHCRDCQSRSGSAFTQTFVVDASELEVTGPLVTITCLLPSGTPFQVKTCARCSSPILTVAQNIPDKLQMRAGSLDGSDLVVPVAHIYTSRKQPWVTLPVDVLEIADAPNTEFLQLVGYL